MFKLDHVIIAVFELDQAVADYRALGFTTIYGGRHANGATHNALVCFQDGTYLELLAPTGDLGAARRDRFQPAAATRRGIGWLSRCCRTICLADTEALRSAGREHRRGG